MFDKFDITTLGAHVNEVIALTGAELTGSRGMLHKHVKNSMMDKLSGQFRPVQKALILERTINDLTDWDFAVEDTIDNRNILTSIGCSEYDLSAQYSDVLTTTVFCMKAPNNSRIEFILKNDMSVFKRVWDDIDVDFYAIYIWKRSSLYDSSEFTPSDIRYNIITLMNMLYKCSK